MNSDPPRARRVTIHEVSKNHDYSLNYQENLKVAQAISYIEKTWWTMLDWQRHFTNSGNDKGSGQITSCFQHSSPSRISPTSSCWSLRCPRSSGFVYFVTQETTKVPAVTVLSGILDHKIFTISGLLTTQAMTKVRHHQPQSSLMNLDIHLDRREAISKFEWNVVVGICFTDAIMDGRQLCLQMSTCNLTPP